MRDPGIFGIPKEVADDLAVATRAARLEADDDPDFFVETRARELEELHELVSSGGAVVDEDYARITLLLYGYDATLTRCGDF